MIQYRIRVLELEVWGYRFDVDVVLDEDGGLLASYTFVNIRPEDHTVKVGIESQRRGHLVPFVD